MRTDARSAFHPPPWMPALTLPVDHGRPCDVDGNRKLRRFTFCPVPGPEASRNAVNSLRSPYVAGDGPIARTRLPSDRTAHAAGTVADPGSSRKVVIIIPTVSARYFGDLTATTPSGACPGRSLPPPGRTAAVGGGKCSGRPRVGSGRTFRTGNIGGRVLGGVRLMPQAWPGDRRHLTAVRHIDKINQAFNSDSGQAVSEVITKPFLTAGNGGLEGSCERFTGSRPRDSGAESPGSAGRPDGRSGRPSRPRRSGGPAWARVGRGGYPRMRLGLLPRAAPRTCSCPGQSSARPSVRLIADGDIGSVGPPG